MFFCQLLGLLHHATALATLWGEDHLPLPFGANRPRPWFRQALRLFAIKGRND